MRGASSMPAVTSPSQPFSLPGSLQVFLSFYHYMNISFWACLGIEFSLGLRNLKNYLFHFIGLAQHKAFSCAELM